jgi:hypothetical protein
MRLGWRPFTMQKYNREQVAIGMRFVLRAADEEEAYMPVLLLWAVPAVIVVGGVGYYLVRAVH